jgi:hypothetical protein
LAQAGASDHKIEQTPLRGSKYIGLSDIAADTDAWRDFEPFERS